MRQYTVTGEESKLLIGVADCLSKCIDHAPDLANDVTNYGYFQHFWNIKLQDKQIR